MTPSWSLAKLPVRATLPQPGAEHANHKPGGGGCRVPHFLGRSLHPRPNPNPAEFIGVIVKAWKNLDNSMVEMCFAGVFSGSWHPSLNDMVIHAPILVQTGWMPLSSRSSLSCCLFSAFFTISICFHSGVDQTDSASKPHPAFHEGT